MVCNAMSSPSGVPSKHDYVEPNSQHSQEIFASPAAESRKPYRQPIVWHNIVKFTYLHVAALYGCFLVFTSAKIVTSIYAILLYQVSMIGTTAGVHRLWAHRTYKAKWPLRVLLMVAQTMAFQNHIYEWARDHRVHHKFSDTDADPHNARRGLFFSHIGWLLVRKHPDVKEKGKSVDLRDLEEDPVVMFQKRYYGILVPLTCFIIPTLIPMYLWGETLSNAWHVATMFRYVINLNFTFCVNSAAHKWGNKPYDRRIVAAENLGVSIWTLGEGWHNYHHVFPWDYKASELGSNRVNFTTRFIDFCALLGQAYDLKTAPQFLIQRRAQRTGDGTHEIWGWGDENLPEDEKDEALILHGKAD